MSQKVAVLGTGKIGEALLSGMIRAGWAPSDLLVTARRPERAEELRARHGVTPASNAEAAKTADTLILTVKPQDMGTLLGELAPHVPADRLIISGAAGIPTSYFEERLAPGTPVVLTGEPPDPSRVPSGCRFHVRCPVLVGGEAERAGVAEACRTRDLPVLSGDGSTQVACHWARARAGSEAATPSG